MNDLALVLAPAVAAIVMGLMARGSTAAATTTNDGALVLRYPRLVRGFLMFASFVTAVLAGISATLPFSDDMPSWTRIATAIGCALLGFATIYLWRERDTTVLVDAIGIHMHDWRRRHRSIQWPDLSDLRYSVINQWWKLIGREGRVLRVSSLLQGATELPTWIRNHVSAPRWRRWSSMIERYQKARKQLEGRQ